MVLSIDFEVAMALKEVLQAKGELKVRPKIQDFSIRRHRTVREASKLSLALWNVCTTMLQDFPGPSFSDSTKGQRKAVKS